MLCIIFSSRFGIFDEIILFQIRVIIVFLKQISINILSVKSSIFIPSHITWARLFIFLAISVILRIRISKVDFLCLSGLLWLSNFISLHACRPIRVSLHINCRVCPSSCLGSFIISRHSLVRCIMNREVVSFSILHQRVIDRSPFVDWASCIQRILLSSHICWILIRVSFHFIWKMRVDIVLKSLLSIFEHLTLKLQTITFNQTQKADFPSNPM